VEVLNVNDGFYCINCCTVTEEQDCVIGIHSYDTMLITDLSLVETGHVVATVDVVACAFARRCAGIVPIVHGTICLRAGASGKGPVTVMLLLDAGNGNVVADGHIHAGAVG